MRQLVLDVSRHDRGIDLAAWRDTHDVWGVIVKMGGHEYLRNADGSLDPYKTFYEDSQRDAHYGSATSLGLHVGAYYYGTATSAQEAREEARHCLEVLGGRFCDLPVYYDVEEPEQLGLDDLHPIVCAFCDAIEAAGYRAGIYSGRDGFAKMGNVDRYALWAASWRESWPSWASTYGMWQQGCMRLSDGDIEYGDADGYTDFDWCQIDYPAQHKNGGGSVAKLSYGLASAEVMDHFIDHDVHGYSQINRDGTDEVETITLSDNTDVSFQSGDRDCSRLVQTCNVVVGALPRGMHMWTGNEREILLANGFVEVSLDEVQRGDVLWRTGHTEMYLGNGIQGGARQSEYGTIDGETGDQTGEEIARSAYDRWEWESAYRCVKERPGEREQPKPAPKPHQEPGDAKNDAGLGYQAHVQDVGWCDPVRDGQTAGTVCYGKRLEAIKFTAIPDGWELTVRAHIANVGWKNYGVVSKDMVIGSTGKGNAIEDLIIGVARRPKGDTRKLYFQVHQENVGWKGVTPEGSASGTDGMGLRLEAVRIWLS